MRTQPLGSLKEPGGFVFWSPHRPYATATRENADVPHVGFGHGPHFCLGAALARAELQEALLALTARLDCPAIEAGAVWKPPVGINGPELLPIRFSARDRRAAGGTG